jgi:hypothetical protein
MFGVTIPRSRIERYAGQLFSGEGSGPSKPFWFPILPSYWGFHGHDSRVVYEGDVAAREQWLSRHEKSIHVHKLSVSYGKVRRGLRLVC